MAFLFGSTFSPILPDFGIFFWTTLIFFIVWSVLARFAFKPIQKMLKKREEDIQNSLDEAKRARDEMAKLHVRHLVGGHSALAQDERLMRFTFPERPGALLKFLSLMQPTWNISLFHYRNQGADYGRILVGMQVPPEDTATFDAFLATLGYPYVEETLNPAYRLFLRSK